MLIFDIPMAKWCKNRYITCLSHDVINNILSLSLAIPTHRQLIENSAAHYRTVEILLLKGPWAAPPTPEAPPPISEVPPPIINRRLKPPIRKY